jgi:hypothetical protein
LRSVKIAASLKDGGWPHDCARYLRSLDDALAEMEARQRPQDTSSECPDGTRRCTLKELRLQLGYALDYVVHGSSDPFDPSQLVALVAQAGIAASASTATAAPPAATLVEPEGLTPLFEGDYLRLLTDPACENSVELLFYEEEERYGLCTVDLVGPARAHCRELDAQIPVGMAGELLAGESGAPLRMYAQGPAGDLDWTHALYDVASGRQIASVTQRPLGGFVWHDGTTARLGLDPPMVSLSLIWEVLGSSERPAPPVALDADGAVTSGPQMVWDEVMWTEMLDDGRHEIFARRAHPNRAALGPKRSLGHTPVIVGKPAFELCSSRDALVVLVEGKRSAEQAEATLLFRTPMGWQAPLDLRMSSGRFGFTCDGAAATFSWVLGDEERDEELGALAPREGDAARPVRGRYHVHRLRCSPRGCEHGKASLDLRRHSHQSRYVAGDLGDAMVMLWRSPVGDVRMRFGALESLHAAPEVPLFDGIEHDGFHWDLEGDPIIGRSGTVLMLLSRPLGEREDASAIYALRIDRDGSRHPVEVTSSTPAL